MKVLFVASGNKAVGKCSSFVQSQYDSLVAEGLDMQLYSVVGHGVKGFLKNVRALRRVIKTWQPDIIHAHYSTFGILASIATIGIRYPHSSPHSPKLLVSILGSFPTRNFKWRYVRFFIQHIWNGTLVKSERTRAQLGLDLPIVPNGVNLDIFHPMDQAECRKQVGLRNDTKYIVWCSNPARPEKNWSLAEEAVMLVNENEDENEKQVELVAVYNKPPQEVATYMNAADCLLLTSDTEGSPNVIKEAMACNAPIVTTNVGDVCERLRNLNGCYIAEDNDCRFIDQHKAATIVAADLKTALDYSQRTLGYQRIIDDGLTIELTAQKIIRIYDTL